VIRFRLLAPRAASLLAIIGTLLSPAHGAAAAAQHPLPHAGTVQVWLSTADKGRLLSHEKDLMFSPAPVGVPVIAIDGGRRYQEMVGFGAAISWSRRGAMH
jgi:hypothetical protein